MFIVVIPLVLELELTQLPLNAAAGATVAVVLALAVAVALALDCEGLEKAFTRSPIPPSTTSATSTVIKTIMPVDKRRVGVGSGVGEGGGVGGAARYTGAGATGSG